MTKERIDDLEADIAFGEEHNKDVDSLMWGIVISRKENTKPNQKEGDGMNDNHIIFAGDWIRSGGGFHPNWRQVQDTRIALGVSQVKVYHQDDGHAWIDAEGRYCTITQVMSDNEMQDTLTIAIA